MAATTEVFEFLISFKESDRSWAEWVDRCLRDAGYRTQLRSWAFQASQAFLEEVEAYHDEGPCLVPILTPAYTTTVHAEPRWLYAFQSGQFSILPVVAKTCDIEHILSVTRYVDLRHMEGDEARDALCSYAQELKGPPPSPTATPVPSQPTADSKEPPAAREPVRRLPFKRDPAFHGREKALEELEKALAQAGRVVVRPTEAGKGGIGRRKLSIEYAYRHAQGYRVIWGLRADRPAVLQEDYARLGHALELPEADGADQAYAAQAVRRWLNRHKGWLLVFHKPSSPDSIREYLPNPEMGQVIINTDLGRWPEKVPVVPLDVWPREEAIAYLLKRTGQDDRAAAESIAEYLEDHPLALSLAGATMVQESLTLEAYKALLEAPLSDLDLFLPGKSAHARAVAFSLCIALEHLWDREPDAVQFLKGFCYLDPYNILPGLLASGARSLPRALARGVTDPDVVEHCIKLLQEYSLAEEALGSVVVHPMIQQQFAAWLESPPGSEAWRRFPFLDETRSFRLSRAAGPLWVRAVLNLVKEAFPRDHDEPGSWEKAASLLAHAYTVLGHAARLSVDAEAQAELWYRLGCYLVRREALYAARDALERALEIDRSAMAVMHGHEARVVRALGQVCDRLDDAPAARKHLERALQLDRGPLHRKTSAVSEDLIRLGNLARRQGETEQALKRYEEALAIDRHLHAQPHEDLLRDYMLLGVALQAQGDLSKAWNCLEQAQGIEQALYTGDHPTRGKLAARIGTVLHHMGDLNQAKDYLARAIDITGRTQGRGHPSLVGVLQELGEIEFEMGQADKARRHFKDAFKIVEAVRGPDDPQGAQLAVWLGRTATELRQPEKARPAFERALATYERVHGANHAKTAEVRRLLDEMAAKP